MSLYVPAVRALRCHLSCAGFMKPPSLPQHLGPADVCSPPFSPPKNTVLTAQRSVEAPGLSLLKNHTPEAEGVITVRFLPHKPSLSAVLCNLNFGLRSKNCGDVVVMQGAMAEKMRREVARLSQETERLEKEVSRQKALR